MSDLYSVRSSGKLKLKGEKRKKKDKKGKKRKHGESDADDARKIFLEDRDAHAGWWPASEFKHITGPICIEFGSHTYVKALDDGTFTLGTKHDSGSGPDPEEVLVAVKVNETKVSFKSGFNKYLKVDKNDQIMGISEAVGAMEQFEPIFQDGKLALLGANNRFLTINDSNESLECTQTKAGSTEMIKIRTNGQREEDVEVYVPVEERGKVGDIELNYVKKFQKFQDHKIRINNDDRGELVKAKNEGYLHEALLDRRAKMKADRYCK